MTTLEDSQQLQIKELEIQLAESQGVEAALNTLNEHLKKSNRELQNQVQSRYKEFFVVLQDHDDRSCSCTDAVGVFWTLAKAQAAVKKQQRKEKIAHHYVIKSFLLDDLCDYPDEWWLREDGTWFHPENK